MSSQSSFPISDNTGSIWPRRASKACASCRRDKIRCDGGRPCGGCVKKGFTADQCTDGCEACRRARLRCEDGKPCRRCVEMCMECTEAGVIPVQLPTTPPPPARPARGGDRAKLACSSCRRDNKKCDDQRPCARCVARSEECIHVSRGPKLVKLRCEGCRVDSKRCEETRPCKYCVESDRRCVTAPRRGRGHGTRVKVACVSCRRDKVRCNGDRPCAACVKKGCKCIDRACTACTRDGKATECTHRRVHDEGLSDPGGEPGPTSEGDTSGNKSATMEILQFPPTQEYSPSAAFSVGRGAQGPFTMASPIYPSHQMLSQPAYYFPPSMVHQASQHPHFMQHPQMWSNVTGPPFYFDSVLDPSFAMTAQQIATSNTRGYLQGNR